MSTAIVSQPEERLLTAEEYAALDFESRTELVKGKVVEVPQPGGVHGKVQVRIARFLDEFADGNGLGHVFTETGVVTRRNPDTVRGPDVSFYSYERLPKGEVPDGYPVAVPEVVFEVLSPSRGLGGELVKVGEYLTAGVTCVCVFDPRRRTVVVYRDDDSISLLTADDILRLPSPLVEWTPPVRDFFPE